MTSSCPEDNRGIVENRSDKTIPLLSLVVPGYNEELLVQQNLAKICDYMESLEAQYRWELIFINDGSTDDTGEIAEQFSLNHDRVTVLHHPYNFRLGQALRYAFSQCRGDYIIVLDLDLSYALEHVPALVEKIMHTKAKIVIASPYMEGGQVTNVPWTRKVMSRWANRYLSLLLTKDIFSDRITCITGMVRAYDRKFLTKLHLRAMDVDIHPEIIYKAMILRARIVEIPAHLKWIHQNVSDTTGVKRRLSSIRILRSILHSLISGFIFRPFLFFVVPGLALILLSLYPIAWAFFHAYQFLSMNLEGHTTFFLPLSKALAHSYNQSPHAIVIGGFCLIVGIQLFSLGILALQKKRYFDELFHLGCSKNANL